MSKSNGGISRNIRGINYAKNVCRLNVYRRETCLVKKCWNKSCRMLVYWRCNFWNVMYTTKLINQGGSIYYLNNRYEYVFVIQLSKNCLKFCVVSCLEFWLCFFDFKNKMKHVKFENWWSCFFLFIVFKCAF